MPASPFATERLYYHDSYLREFDARVLSCEPAGPQAAVVLDRTAFYPASGGQPCDTGRLGEAEVVEVIEDDAGCILHLADRPVAPGPVRARIDWNRRFDHMQQHTGQHLLSAAFLALFKFPTVSFHLGREAATIDLQTPSLVPRHLEEAAHLANQVIFENRPVGTSFRTAEELAAAGVRKHVAREGPLRVVEIEEFDRQPCGGTHVARTGEVGLILLRKHEKVKQNWRVEFVCGFRAQAAARGDFGLLTEAARLLSCGPPDVPAIVRKLVEEGRAAERGRRQVLERLAACEAGVLRGQEVSAGTAGGAERAGRILVRVFEDAEPAYLALLAAQLIAEPGVAVLLATRAGGNVVFAQAVGGRHDLAAALREAVARAGGKGGGTRDFAQGSVPDAARLDEVLAHAAAGLA